MTDPVIRTVGFRPGERNVFFHVLTACNLSCQHCYINPDQHGHERVPRQTMEDWLKLLVKPDRETNVIFLGGEPTMHPDLVHGVRRAKELGAGSVTVDTNGYLLHDFLEKVTPAELDCISFSLDGPSPEVNDPVRGDGVFAVCTANLRRAVAVGFNVSLIYTVSRRNIGELYRMPPLLAEWGVKKFFIQVIGIRGRTAGEAESSWQVNHKDWLAVVPAVAKTAAALGINVTYPKVFLDESEVFECAGRVAENFFVFPNGRVYRCPLCEDFPLNSLHIEDNRLVANPGLTEEQLFSLEIAEGCVMNKLLQPGNLDYDAGGRPRYRISCCLLKQQIRPSGSST